MSTKIDLSLILDAIKKHYNFTKNVEFASFLGIKPQTLSSWYSRNSMDYDLVYSKCVDIDANWLFTGRGNMLKSDAKKSNSIYDLENEINRIVAETQLILIPVKRRLLQATQAAYTFI